MQVNGVHSIEPQTGREAYYLAQITSLKLALRNARQKPENIAVIIKQRDTLLDEISKLREILEAERVKRTATEALLRKYATLAPTSSAALVNSILSMTAMVTGVTVDDIKSMSRIRRKVRARHIAVFLIRRHTKKSLPEIAACVGKKHHTTIISSLNVTEHRYTDFHDKIIETEQRLGLSGKGRDVNSVDIEK